MKKSLYGTTALVAVGLTAGPAWAAEPIHLELGGYYSQFFGYTSSDQNTRGTGNDNTHEISNYQNAEVHFLMKGELDNGLVIGGRLELEAESNPDQFDQTYLTVEGGFGQLRLGAINSGRYSYGWNTDPFWGGVAPAGVPISSGWMSVFGVVTNGSGFRFRQPSLSTTIDSSNDEQKITYFTPRFNGFQLAFSYTPEATDVFGGGIGQGGETFSPGFTGPADEQSLYTNGLDLGISYSGDLGAVGMSNIGVEFQGGLFYADAPGMAKRAGFDDYWGGNGGLLFITDLAGGSFSIGGAFASVQEGLALRCSGSAFTPVGTCAGASGLTSTEGEAYHVGASYAIGPWGFTAGYFRGESEELVANPSQEANEFVDAGVMYSLGPGIDTNLSFLYINREAENPARGPTLGTDNEAFAVVWGWYLWF